ncbi:MAG: 3-dehydroquinate synthase II [Promethearchaeota archaeon]
MLKSKQIILDLSAYIDQSIIEAKIKEALAHNIYDFILPLEVDSSNIILDSKSLPITFLKITDFKTVHQISANSEPELRSLFESSAKICFDLSKNEWEVIPLENIIAWATNTTSKIYSRVNSLGKLNLHFEILEKGVDGVIIDEKAVNYAELDKVRLKLTDTCLSLTEVKIVEIKSVGSGDRCCLDTAVLLDDTEGMLIGNFSSGFFLIRAENILTDQIPPRPFRVNAGAVHCYLYTPTKTFYLSELKSGSEVFVVNNEGRGRCVPLGRNKIEQRPMVQVTAETDVDKESISIIVQLAETIRFGARTERGYITVDQLKSGDKVLAYFPSTKSRHFGTEINESIQEI